eukprot:403367787
MGASLSETLPENENAKHRVVIEYCGVRPYESEAYEMVIKLNKKFPGQFKFVVSRDSGFTDRLECQIIFDAAKPRKARQVVIHSKTRGMGHADSNWRAFLDRASEALFNHELLK